MDNSPHNQREAQEPVEPQSTKTGLLKSLALLKVGIIEVLLIVGKL